IIHRDIKPENIMIDKDGRVRILDFGLAKLKGMTRLTRASSTLGTLNYMSPEQLQGMEVDYRTDIWSVGVVLYEMLTQRLPFQGDYEASFTYSAMNEEPQSLSTLRSDLPPQFELIVNKTLCKNPEERYQVAGDIAMDLRSSQAAMSAPATKPAKKKLSRVKKLLLGFAAFCLLTIGVLAWYIYPFLSVPEPIEQQHDKGIAVLYFENMSVVEDEYFSDGLTEELISRLTRIKNLKVASRTDVRLYKLKPASISVIGKELSVDFVVEGSVRKAGNRTRITAQLISTSDGSHRWTETYDRESADIFEVQDDVAKNIAQRLDMEISNRDQSAIAKRPTENQEAYDLVLQAKSRLFNISGSSSRSEFNEIRSMLKRALELDPLYSDANGVLAASYLFQLDGPSGQIELQEKAHFVRMASSAAERALEVDASNELALSMLPLALVGRATEEFESWGIDRLLLYRKAKITIDRLAELYPKSPVANLALGAYYQYLSTVPILGEDGSKLSLKYHLQAVLESEKILKSAPTDPTAVFVARTSCFSLGWIHLMMARHSEALHYFEKFDAAARKTGDKGQEIDATIFLGIVHLRMGEYDRALGFSKRALALSREAGMKFPEGVAVSLHFLGEIKFLMGDYHKASEYFEEASELWTNIADKKNNLWTLSWWSMSQLKSGNLEAALAKAQQTEELMQETQPFSDAVIIVNWNLSQVYAELGDKEKSQKFLKIAHDTVIEKANKFADSRDREAFLAKIRENREVVVAWEKLNR
ncbi:MAG: tetratricopeptide repeat protein, partial [bacterium]